MDINVKVKEKGKQSIGLQGGISGLAGGFIGLTYQTNNFLGLGETLTFSAQFGDLQRIFQFGFTEPYLFDRPISTGFTLFSSRYSFDQAKQEALLLGQQVSVNPNYILNYTQDSTGFTTFASYPIRRFSFTRLGLSYGLTRTSITPFNDATTLLLTQLQFRNVAGPSALHGIISSTITPSLSYNTVDNPINPSRGKSFFYSASVQGGPLGGNVNVITNVFEWKKFHPMNKHRNVLGFRVQASHTTSYGGLELPLYNRFFMGGETDLRGFDVRGISPVAFIPAKSTVPVHFTDPRGFCPLGCTVQVPVIAYTVTFPGGDLQGVGNVEYRIPIVKEIVQMSLFTDAGTNGIVSRSGLKLDPTGVQQFQQQFPGANVKSQLGIASGTNFKFRSSAGIEFIVQLPIIQAPFRIYYAFNPNRLHSRILAPQGDWDHAFVAENLIKPLPPGVFQLKVQPQLDRFRNNPIQLNFFEPAHTFRFSVGRTF